MRLHFTGHGTAVRNLNNAMNGTFGGKDTLPGLLQLVGGRAWLLSALADQQGGAHACGIGGTRLWAGTLQVQHLTLWVHVCRKAFTSRCHLSTQRLCPCGAMPAPDYGVNLPGCSCPACAPSRSSTAAYCIELLLPAGGHGPAVACSGAGGASVWWQPLQPCPVLEGAGQAAHVLYSTPCM